jgi:large subunit ribosomal protein L23
MTSLDRCYHLIQKAVITEKATDDGARRNAYHFRVPMDANKVEIRQAVHRLFGVDVLSVNTARVRGKGRRRRYAVGQTPDWKKAMVTLAEGQAIEIL